MKTVQMVLTKKAFNASLAIQSAKPVPNTAPYFALLAIPSQSSLSWTETLAHPNAHMEILAISQLANVRPAISLVHRAPAMQTLVLLVTRQYPQNTSTTTCVLANVPSHLLRMLKPDQPSVKVVPQTATTVLGRKKSAQVVPQVSFLTLLKT